MKNFFRNPKRKRQIAKLKAKCEELGIEPPLCGKYRVLKKLVKNNLPKGEETEKKQKIKSGINPINKKLVKPVKKKRFNKPPASKRIKSDGYHKPLKKKKRKKKRKSFNVRFSWGSHNNFVKNRSNNDDIDLRKHKTELEYLVNLKAFIDLYYLIYSGLSGFRNYGSPLGDFKTVNSVVKRLSEIDQTFKEINIPRRFNSDFTKTNIRSINLIAEEVNVLLNGFVTKWLAIFNNDIIREQKEEFKSASSYAFKDLRDKFHNESVFDRLTPIDDYLEKKSHDLKESNRHIKNNPKSAYLKYRRDLMSLMDSMKLLFPDAGTFEAEQFDYEQVDEEIMVA